MHELSAADTRHLAKVDELNERASQSRKEREKFESELEDMRKKDATSTHLASG